MAKKMTRVRQMVVDGLRARQDEGPNRTHEAVLVLNEHLGSVEKRQALAGVQVRRMGVAKNKVKAVDREMARLVVEAEVAGDADLCEALR